MAAPPPSTGTDERFANAMFGKNRMKEAGADVDGDGTIEEDEVLNLQTLNYCTPGGMRRGEMQVPAGGFSKYTIAMTNKAKGDRVRREGRVGRCQERKFEALVRGGAEDPVEDRFTSCHVEFARYYEESLPARQRAVIRAREERVADRVERCSFYKDVLLVDSSINQFRGRRRRLEDH